MSEEIDAAINRDLTLVVLNQYKKACCILKDTSNYQAALHEVAIAFVIITLSNNRKHILNINSVIQAIIFHEDHDKDNAIKMLEYFINQLEN